MKFKKKKKQLLHRICSVKSQTVRTVNFIKHLSVCSNSTPMSRHPSVYAVFFSCPVVQRSICAVGWHLVVWTQNANRFKPALSSTHCMSFTVFNISGYFFKGVQGVISGTGNSRASVFASWSTRKFSQVEFGDSPEERMNAFLSRAACSLYHIRWLTMYKVSM